MDIENEKPRYLYFGKEIEQLKEEKKKLLETNEILWKMYEVKFMRDGGELK